MNALQQVITVVGLPIFIMVSMMVVSMIVALRNEGIDRVDIDEPDIPEHARDRNPAE